MSYLIPFFSTIAVCFGIQTFALRSIGGRTLKSESNFFSSIARIQTGIQGTPKVMLLGSSMTGRFPDRTNGFAEVTNLGCDGGSAVDTIRAMDRGILPRAPTLIIEGNTLYRDVGTQTSEIANALSSPWFRLGVHFAPLGATARPSAFAYSSLLSGKIGKAEGLDGPVLPITPIPRIESSGTLVSQRQEDLIQELTAIINRFQKSGTKIYITIIPPGAPNDSPNIQMPMRLSTVAQVPLIDLTTSLPLGSVRFTDGVHMAPASAAATLRSILAVTQP